MKWISSLDLLFYLSVSLLSNKFFHALTLNPSPLKNPPVFDHPLIKGDKRGEENTNLTSPNPSLVRRGKSLPFSREVPEGGWVKKRDFQQRVPTRGTPTKLKQKLPSYEEGCFKAGGLLFVVHKNSTIFSHCSQKHFFTKVLFMLRGKFM
jgi:hypothetical protein